LASHDIPIPDDWEIHVYPGNNFASTTSILKTATIPDCVKNVILAVGINHRDWKFVTSTKPDWYKMVAEAKRLKPTVHFLGVSTVDLPETIKAINQSGMKSFGDKFIPALPEDQVTISPIDPFVCITMALFLRSSSNICPALMTRGPVDFISYLKYTKI